MTVELRSIVLEKVTSRRFVTCAWGYVLTTK